MKTGTIIGQFIGTILFCGLFGLVGVAMVGAGAFANMTTETRAIMIGMGIFFCCVTGFIYALGPAHDYQWVELDGDILRSKHLYTRKVTERPVREINDILSEVMMLRTVAVRIVEKRQGRIRAFSFRFHDLPKGIKVFRPEMTNVAELVSAVIGKMSQFGEVEPEIRNFEGTPIVRRVHWANPRAVERPGIIR